MLFLFLVILAYVMGSFCSAVIVSKTFSLPDPRTEGSQNPGATNVLRLSGKKYALLVLFADILKGVIPVVLAKFLGAGAVTIGYTALAAVIGHMYPVFFDFKGGKGVATAIGALLGFQFVVGSMVIATWLLVARFARYSSLASIVAIGLAPFYSLLLIGRMDIFPPIFFMAVLILIQHRQNISRLIEGTEPKVNLKSNVIKEIMDEEPSAPITAIIESTEIEPAEEIEVPVTPKKVTAPKAKTATKKISIIEEPEKKAKPAAAKPKKPKIEK